MGARMIESIQIKDSAVFDNLTLTLHNGLNVFSGASGSGKSVFMESLLALFGIKESNATQIQGLLSEHSLDLDSYGITQQDELLLNITKSPKARYFINGSLIAKKTLQDLLSGSIKYISLKNATELLAPNLLRVFDLFICAQEKAFAPLLARMQADFTELERAREAYERLLSEEARIVELREFANFEIQKIQSINPKIGEYEELLELKKSLSKKEKIQEKLALALESLENLHTIQSTLELLQKPSALFDEALLEVREILHDEEARLESLESLEPEALLDRIAKLSELNHRYGSIESALEHLQKTQAKLQEYDNISFNKDKLKKELQTLESACLENAKEISSYRARFLKDFEAKLSELCALLKLSHLKASLKESPLIATGLEELTLTLKDTSISALSTGEYNRLRLAMLCISAQLSTQAGILMLDEIDANLSGEESEGVAKVLKELSKSYQIFAISHQPHIPALADHHYLVAKTEGSSSISLLDSQGQIQEIARMISGANITQEALDFAKKRLGL